MGGVRGVAAGIYAQARVLMRLARTARRGAPPDDQRSARDEARARALGVADFLRGRWGPPPPHLPGLGDVGS